MYCSDQRYVSLDFRVCWQSLPAMCITVMATYLSPTAKSIAVAGCTMVQLPHIFNYYLEDSASKHKAAEASVCSYRSVYIRLHQVNHIQVKLFQPDLCSHNV